MKTIDFCKKYKPCDKGKDFALSFTTMNEVWNSCERTDWLFWILEKHAPLEKEQSVRLAIAFAETCLANVSEGEDRPRLTVEAAKAWLVNPCEETAQAAESAARSAESAARSAESAARSAAWSAWSAESAAWSARSAAWSARSAARSAAWSAARSAAWSAEESAAWSARSAAWSAESAKKQQCEILRETIPNPFQP